MARRQMQSLLEVREHLAGDRIECLICGRPTIEDEARRRSADAPELLEGIIEAERSKIELLTPVLRRLMD